MTALPPAVVMGLSPTGLHAVRALADAGVAVTGMGAGAAPGRWSRRLSGVIPETDPERRLAALERLPEGAVLIPCSDAEVDFVIAHAPRLARRFAFQASYGDGLAATIMDKDGFAGLCRDHGIAHPESRHCDAAGLAAVAASLGYPVLAKPARIHDIRAAMAGAKGWVLRDAAGARDAAAAIPAGAPLVVQRIVPGPESAITLWCGWLEENGPHAGFTARKLRQYPPGFGSASLAQSAPEPESAAIAARFLGALGYRGIAAAEFKRDPVTGALEIIEINVRPSLWFSLSQAAGRPVVETAYRSLAGLAPLPETPQRDGMRWRYALKDAASARFWARSRDFVLPPPDIEAAGPARARTAPVWDRADPGPALAELANFAGKGAARIAGRIGKRPR